MRAARGASWLEYMVLVGALVLAVCGVFVALGGSFKLGAMCLGESVGSSGGVGNCGKAPPPKETGAVPSALVAARGAVEPAAVCVGGTCTGGKCFVAGTLVGTEAGLRPIEAIAPGTEVLAWDAETGEVKPRRVLLTTRKARRTVDVVVQVGEITETLGVTPEHPLLVAGRGWIPAGELGPGDAVVTGAGETAAVVAVRPRREEEEVYNLEVEHAHTYFAGRSGLVAHNDCETPIDPAFTIRDLERLPLVEQLGIVDYWVRLTNGQREALNVRLNQMRQQNRGDIAQTLRDLAAPAISERRARERDDAGRAALLGLDGRAFAGQVDANEAATRAQERMLTDVRSRFDLGNYRAPPADPRVALLRRPTGPTRPEQLRGISDDLARMLDVRRAAAGNQPEGDRFLRVPTNLLRGAVGRTPLAYAFSPEDLQTEKSPEELFRERLLRFGLLEGDDVEFESNGAGVITVRPGADPAVRQALETLLRPGNFERVDTAAQRAAGQNVAGDGAIALIDLQAVANGDFPPELKRAAAVLAIAENFARLDTAAFPGTRPDGLVARIDVDAMLERSRRPARVLHRIEPRMLRVWVPDARGVAPARDDVRYPGDHASHGRVIEVERWSPLGEEIARREADLLAQRTSIQDFTRFLIGDASRRASDEAAAARARLRAETERLLAEVEGLPGTRIFQRSVQVEANAGINERLHREYLDRAWYERLGVGTWAAVKEVLMIPIGLGELAVYVTDHGNVVVWTRGRPEGGKLLWQLSGEEIDQLGAGIEHAFQDWWASAQAEPDRAIGQTIGFVGTFFIPISKLSKVTRLSSGAVTAIDRAQKLRAAGRFEEAAAQLDRAARYTRQLEELARARTAGATGRAATEETRLEALARELDGALVRAQTELNAAGRSAAASGRATTVVDATALGQCFAAGTRVRTVRAASPAASGAEESFAAIESLTAGDVVLARDPGGETVPRRVVRTFQRTSDHLRVVRTRDGPGHAVASIATTDEHPFFVEGRGFVPASGLAAGDVLATDDGRPVMVAGTERIARPEGVRVYNFEVEGAHTYFVAPERGAAVLVHNLCTGPLLGVEPVLGLGGRSRVQLRADPGWAIETANGQRVAAHQVDLAPTLERVAADVAPAWRESQPVADAATLFSDRPAARLREYPVLVDGQPSRNARLVVDEATGESWLVNRTAPGGPQKIAVTGAIRAATPVAADRVTLARQYFAGSPNSKLAEEYATRMNAAAERGRVLFDGRPRTTEELQEVFRAMHREAKAGGGELVVDRVARNPADGAVVLQNGRAHETENMFRYLDEIGVARAERPAIRDVPPEAWPANIGGHQYPVWSAHGAYWDSASASLNRFNTAVTRMERAGTLAERAAAESEALAELADFTHTMANLRPTNGSTNFGVVMAITNQGLVRMGKPPVFAGVVDMVAMRTNVTDFRRVFADHVAGRINLADEHRFERVLRYLDLNKRDGRPPPPPAPAPAVETPPPAVPPPPPPAPAAVARPAAAPPSAAAVAEGIEAVRGLPRLLEGVSVRIRRSSGAFEEGWVVTHVEQRGSDLLVHAMRADGWRRVQKIEEIAEHNPSVIANFGEGNAVLVPPVRAPAPPAPSAVAARLTAVNDAIRANPERLIGSSVRVQRSSGGVETGWVVTRIERRGNEVIVWTNNGRLDRWQPLREIVDNNFQLVDRLVAR